MPSFPSARVREPVDEPVVQHRGVQRPGRDGGAELHRERVQNDIAFLAEYSSFSKNVDFAGRMVYDDNGVEVFNFGKYKGMSVAEVLKKDPGYYSWILNSDFTLNTKAVLTKIRLREMSNLITK